MQPTQVICDHRLEKQAKQNSRREQLLAEILQRKKSRQMDPMNAQGVLDVSQPMLWTL